MILMLLPLVSLVIIFYFLYKRDLSLYDDSDYKDFISVMSNNSIVKGKIEKINLINSHFFEGIRTKSIQAGIIETKKHDFIILLMLVVPVIISPIGIYLTNKFIDNPKLLHYIIICISISVIGFYYPINKLNSIIKKRSLEFEIHFPDILDLLIICTQAGVGVNQAYNKVTEEYTKISSVIVTEISILSAEITYFLDSKVAYDNLQVRIDNDDIKNFCSTMVQAQQYGTSISEALQNLSSEVRSKQMAKIEKKSASLPSKLTIPMMIFSLPVLFAFILTPAIMKLM